MKVNFTHLISKKITLIAAGFALLAVAVFFVLKAHHPQPKPRRTDIPDYSGITVERVLTHIDKPGKGRTVHEKDVVDVIYKMWIYDPAALGNRGPAIAADDSQQLKIGVGQGEVIKGWEQALLGMKAGESATIVIPVDLAYGEAGLPGKIPGGAIVQIEMKLVKIEK